MGTYKNQQHFAIQQNPKTKIINTTYYQLLISFLLKKIFKMPRRDTKKTPEKTYNEDDVTTTKRTQTHRSPIRGQSPYKKTPQAPQKPKRDNNDVIKRRRTINTRSPTPSTDEGEEFPISPPATPPPKKYLKRKSRDEEESEDESEEAVKYARSLSSRRSQTVTTPKNTLFDELRENNETVEITYVDIEHNEHKVVSYNPTVDTLASLIKHCEKGYRTDSIIFISQKTKQIISPNTIVNFIKGDTIDGYHYKLKFVVYQNGKVIKRGIEEKSSSTIAHLRKQLDLLPSTSLKFGDTPSQGFYLPPHTYLATLFYKVWENNKNFKITDVINVNVPTESRVVSFLQKAQQKDEKDIYTDEIVPKKITYLALRDLLSKKCIDSTRGYTLYNGTTPIRNLLRMVPEKVEDSFHFVNESFDVHCTTFLPKITPQKKEKVVSVLGNFTGSQLLELVVGKTSGFTIFRIYRNKPIYEDDYLGEHLSTDVCYVRICMDQDPLKFQMRSRFDSGSCVQIQKPSSELETDDGEPMENSCEYETDEESDDEDPEERDSDDDEDDIIDDEFVDPDLYIHTKVQMGFDEENYSEVKFHVSFTVEEAIKQLLQDFPLSQKYVYKFKHPDGRIIDLLNIDHGEPISCHLKNDSKIFVAYKDSISFTVSLPNGDIFDKDCNKSWRLSHLMSDLVGVKCKNFRLIHKSGIVEDNLSLKKNFVGTTITDGATIEIECDM